MAKLQDPVLGIQVSHINWHAHPKRVNPIARH